MFKHATIVIGALAFFGAGLVSATPSVAASMDRAPTCCTTYDGYDHKYNDRGNTFVIESLTERINAMELAIIEALRLGTGQVSGNLKEQIGADSNLANAQDDRAVVGRIEEARLEAIREAASGGSSCRVLTGAVGGTGLETAAMDFGRQLSVDMSKWSTGEGNMPSSEGTAVAIAARVTTHCSKYGNAQDVRSGLCTDVGALPNASINAMQSLFYMEPGTLSGTQSAERLEASYAFIVNAVNPRPLGAVLQSDPNTPAGREEAGRRIADFTRISIADSSMGDVLARRSPQTGDSYTDHLRASVSQIPGYNGAFDNGASWYDYMDVTARGWHFNTNWGIKVDSGFLAQAMKDVAMIESYNAYLGWETYKLIEKQNVILAAMLAITTENQRSGN